MNISLFFLYISWCSYSVLNVYGYHFIIIPGMGGSVLYNDQQKKIWPPDITMNLNELRFKFDHLNDPILPLINNVGNINDVKIDNSLTYLFTKSTYYSTLIDYLEKRHFISAFPYDFRFMFFPKYYLQLYEEFNNFLETKDEIIFICHSMGGLLLHDFLHHYIKSKNIRKIKKIYYVNVPFGGVPFSFYAIYNSLNPKKEISVHSLVPTQIIPYLTSRIKHLHHFGGLYLALPTHSNPIFRKDDQWYNIHSIEPLLSNDPICLSNYKTFMKNHLPYRSKSLPLDQVVVYSTNISTSIFLDHNTQTILSSLGDGLVPIDSLLYPMKWKHQPIYVELSNQEHSKINNYMPLIKMFSQCDNYLIYK